MLIYINLNSYVKKHHLRKYWQSYWMAFSSIFVSVEAVVFFLSSRCKNSHLVSHALVWSLMQAPFSRLLSHAQGLPDMRQGTRGVRQGRFPERPPRHSAASEDWSGRGAASKRPHAVERLLKFLFSHESSQKWLSWRSIGRAGARPSRRQPEIKWSKKSHPKSFGIIRMMMFFYDFWIAKWL